MCLSIHVSIYRRILSRGDISCDEFCVQPSCSPSVNPLGMLRERSQPIHAWRSSIFSPRVNEFFIDPFVDRARVEFMAPRPFAEGKSRRSDYLPIDATIAGVGSFAGEETDDRETLNAREERVHWPTASTLAAGPRCPEGTRPRSPGPSYLLHNRAGGAEKRPVCNPENRPRRNYGALARQRSERKEKRNGRVRRACDSEMTRRRVATLPRVFNPEVGEGRKLQIMLEMRDLQN